MTVPPRPKPLLRGVSHEIALVFALAGAAVLVLAAPTSRASVAAAIYGVGLAALFGVSALYHRPMWALAPRAVLKRLDHSMIFFFIAATGTPFGVLVGGRPGLLFLAAIWGGATLGMLRAVLWPKAPRWLTALLYVALGYLVVPVLPRLWRAVGPSGVVLIGVGGVLYSLGAVVYATRRPDPNPRVFGYHEIFHLMVIAASVCHFIAVSSAVRAIR
jgi:hemolysin III